MKWKKRIPYWNNYCPYGANSRLSVLLNSYCFLFQDRIEYQKFERERMHSRWTKVSSICFLSTACLSSDCQTLSYDIFSSFFFHKLFLIPLLSCLCFSFVNTTSVLMKREFRTDEVFLSWMLSSRVFYAFFLFSLLVDRLKQNMRISYSLSINLL